MFYYRELAMGIDFYKFNINDEFSFGKPLLFLYYLNQIHSYNSLLYRVSYFNEDLKNSTIR